MGSITRRAELDDNLTVFTVLGEADARHVLNEIVTFLLEVPTQQVLWDIRGGTLSALSAEDLKMIVARAAPLTQVRAGGRTAIVCSREVDFGLCRQFQAFAEMAEIPFEINVLRDLEEAHRWLRSGA